MEISFKKLIVAGGLIVIIVVGVWLWPFAETFISSIFSSSGQTYIEPTSLNSAIASGDTAQAAREASALLSSGAALSPTDTAYAHLAIADSYLATATSSDSQIEALSKLLQSYHEATDPFTRAWIIDRFAGFALKLPYAPVAGLLSRDSEFNSMVASTSIKTFHNIAVYSYTIYPTSEAAYIAAQSDAHVLIDSYVANKGVRETNVVRAATSSIAEWLKKGDSAREIEQQYVSPSSYAGASFSSLIDLYRSYPLSAIALYDQSYQSDADSTFQAIYSYESSQDQNSDNPNPQLLQLTIPAHFSQAWFSLLKDPVLNKSKIENNLSEIVRLIHKYPDQLQSELNLFSISDAVANRSAQAHSDLVRMANISPEFKAFLKTQGWQL